PDNDEHGEHHEAVLVYQSSGLHEELRGPRQATPEVFVNSAEAWHDVAEQERDDENARSTQHERIDRRTDQFLAEQIDLLLIRDVAHERLADRARALARPHRRDVQRRKARRQLFERGRERAPLEETRANLLERTARARAGLLLRERVDRLDEREAG